jgi:hypothetical protein
MTLSISPAHAWQDWEVQDRQYTYKVTLRYLRKTTVAVEKQ